MESQGPLTIFVDGENISRKEIASLNCRFPSSARKMIYQSDRAARKQGYPGYEHRVIPWIGKESVDKVIAMDAVAAYFHGVRRIYLVSNDHDYGATALHLKNQFKDLDIGLICDPCRVHTNYIRQMKKAGIRVEATSADVNLDEFACKVLEVIHELWHRGTLNLSRLGDELRRRGIEYKNLRKELVNHRVIDSESEGNDFQLTEVAQRKLGLGAP